MNLKFSTTGNSKKTWHFNTTSRSPLRLQDILAVLKQFEGQMCTDALRGEFMDKVVEAGLYEPLEPIADKELRGRTWIGIFNQLGFATAFVGEPTTVTPAGESLLAADEHNIDEVFLRQLLKLQFPNPLARGYAGANIKPFIALLIFLGELELLSFDELALFVVTCVHFKDIPDRIRSIRRFRRKIEKARGNNRRSFIAKYYQDIAKLADVKPETLRDYADVIQRYTRITAVVSNEGRSLRLLAARQEDAADILESFTPELTTFPDKQSFLDYFRSSDRPTLPNEKESSLKRIISSLVDYRDQLVEQHDEAGLPPYKPNEVPDPTGLSVPQLKKLSIALRTEIKEIVGLIERSRFKSPEGIGRIIDDLRRIQAGDREIPDLPSYFELFVFRAFEVLDTPMKVVPNFPMDENRLPIDHAVGNKPDVEVYYEDFVLIPEVTLKTGATQYRDESMPVYRHVINIKNGLNNDSPVFGLFVAPAIHGDTQGAFYLTGKHGLGGGQVTIIPITLDQFIDILEHFRLVLTKREITHDDIRLLLALFDEALCRSKNDKEWIGSFPQCLANWKKQILMPN